MLVAFLLGRRLWPRYAVPGVLLAGIAVAALQGRLAPGGDALGAGHAGVDGAGVQPGALVGLALPLFVVTMASQNLPGVAATRAAGYARCRSRRDRHADRRRDAAAGAVRRVMRFNLAAITAAICMGREAHEDPARRYTAAGGAGVLYVLIGLVGGAVAGAAAGLPARTGAGGRRAGAAGHHRRRPGRGAERRGAPRGRRADHFLVTLSGVDAAGASARPSGAWSPARSRCLCNSTGPAASTSDTAMKLLFVADPLESFKTYKDTTFAMMREAAARGHASVACEPADLAWQRGAPVQRAVCACAHADRRRRRLVRRSQRRRRPGAGRLRRGADAQGPAVRQRVLLRHPPAASRPSARARASSTGRARCATTRRSWRSWSSRSSSRRRW